MRLSLFLTVLLIGPAFAEAVAGESIPAHLASEYAEIQLGFVAVREGRCDEALVRLRPIADGSSFVEYPASVRVPTLQAVTLCLYMAPDVEATLHYLQRLLQYDGIDRSRWLEWLLTVSAELGRAELALDSVEALAESDPAALSQIGSQFLYKVYAIVSASTLGEEARFRFLRAIYESGYTTPNPFHYEDYFLVDYAAMLIDRGDSASARQIVLRLNDLGTIVRVRIDRRFDSMRQDGSLETFLDLDDAAEREIRRLRQLIDEQPNYLLGYVRLSETLAAVWRFDEALEVIEPAAWKARTPLLNRLFTDIDENKSWALAEYSAALRRQKYPEQAAAIYSETIVDPDIIDPADFDIGEGDPSHAINLANRAFWAGQFEFALAFVEMLDAADKSPYGEMVVKMVEVCTKAMQDPQGDYRPALNYMLEHERSGPGQMVKAYLCLDDLDAAAEYTILRLERPEQRVAALLSLQYSREYGETDRLDHEHDPAENVSPGHLIRDRHARLRARRDVQVAVDKVGRLELIPLQHKVWHRH